MRGLVGVLGLAVCMVTKAAADGDGGMELGSVLAGNKNLTKFSDLIKKYPDILLQLPSQNGVTIVAPSNAAFDNIPYTSLNGVWDPENKDKTIPILQYHILSEPVATKDLSEGPAYLKKTLLTDPRYTNVTDGQNVVINKQAGDVVVFTSGQGTRCTLKQADIAFQGGMIQIVDNFLIPPAGIDKTAQAFQATSFLGSLFTAKLMPNVSYESNVTIFAPQDAAFAAVGGSLQHLNSSKLANIMEYHVVPGRVVVADDLTNGTKLATLSTGGTRAKKLLTVRQDGNNKYINSAQIVQPNILIANGIVHIISNVLNPDVEDTIPNGQQASQAPVFAVSTVSGIFTSALPCSTNCPTTSTKGATGTAAGTATATPTSSALFTSSSHGAVAPRCTAHVAGAAVGMLGLGVGMVWL